VARFEAVANTSGHSELVAPVADRLAVTFHDKLEEDRVPWNYTTCRSICTHGARNMCMHAHTYIQTSLAQGYNPLTLINIQHLCIMKVNRRRIQLF
jgi:hypothetical protein